MINIDQFSEQLAILHRDMQIFAEQYPEQARLLNLNELNDKDPHVERLLEGVAFMNAMIQERMDADLPEISQTLLEQFSPQLIRPLPSLTIMQATPRFGQVQKLSIIPKGAMFSSQQVGPEHASCHFVTTEDLAVNPIYVANVESKELMEGGTQISLYLQFESAVNVAACRLDPLVFYINAETALLKSLIVSLIQPDNEVSIEFPEMPSVRKRLLPRNAIHLKKISHDNLLLPNSGSDHLAYRWLHEILNYQEKYYFIEIDGIELEKFPQFCEKIKIDIKTSMRLSNKLNLKKENFQLHCVPAINLYETTSEPITFDHKKLEYNVIANTQQSHSLKIYQVDEVNAVNTQTGLRERLPAMTSFANQGKAYFHERIVDHADGHRDSRLSVEGLSLDKHRLSCQVKVFNGDYPRQYLRTGDITINKNNYSFVSFKNITRPTTLKTSNKEKGYYWQLIQHFRLNLQAIKTADDLKKLLSLYLWNEQVELINQINSIKAFSIDNIERIKRGGLRFGIQVKLKIDEAKLASEMDAYWFGYVLHEFFTLQAPINQFVITEISFIKMDKQLTWGLQ